MLIWSPPAAVAAWFVSLVLEVALAATVSLFFVVTLAQVVPALAATAGLYFLGRIVAGPFFSPRGTSIHVKLETLGDSVQLSVHDQGIGIPQEQLSRVFEPFFQAANNTSEEGVGLGLYLAMALIDYRLICQWAVVWYVLAAGLLLFVLVAGTRVHGSKSWFGWRGYGVQPAEFAKLAVIVAISYYLFHRTPQQRGQWDTVAGGLVLVGVPVLLILVQPDLGSALVLIPICFGLMFVAGVRVKHLLLVVAVGVCLLPVAWWKLKSYQKDRLTVFLHPNRDPLGAGWNLNQSLIAVGSGGCSGKGYLQGTQNLLGYLPRTVAPNDFLFSVIGEEKGFVGSACVVGLYAVILFSGLRIAASARDRLGTLRWRTKSSNKRRE